MALLVRDMCTAAVPGHANFFMAILVYRIPPAAPLVQPDQVFLGRHLFHTFKGLTPYSDYKDQLKGRIRVVQW